MGFRVSSYTKDSYDSLRVQLEESIAANLEAMGSMVSKVGFPQVEMRKTPEGLNAMVKPLRTFQPLGQWRWRKPLKTKKHHFPDSIQIQLWGCKLLVEHPEIPIVSSLKVCKKLINKVDPRWFQRFYVFTRILGVSWSNLTFIFFKLVGSTTN